MSLGVGINEDVVLDSVETNDKKHLVLTFRQRSEIDLFDQLSAAEVSDGESKIPMRIFPFKVPDKKDLTESQKIDRVIKDVQRTRNVMIHFLQNFFTKAEIDLDPYKGTSIQKGISNKDLQKAHLSQQNLDKIWLNMSNNFIRLAKTIAGNDELPFRLKLRRQSKEKHFASFPDSYLDSEPFIEPMTVPLESSRVKFSKYELREGLDNPDALPASAADTPPADDDGLGDNSFSTDNSMFAGAGGDLTPPDDLPL